MGAKRKHCSGACICLLLLHLNFLLHCDGRKSMEIIGTSLEQSNTQPFDVTLPQNSPPQPLSNPLPNSLWCVAKPSVPEPIIEEAMNYACGSGADCNLIQANGPCFEPDTLFAHASFAFNSYWQRLKVGGATCEFGGVAMLVLLDPSYDQCRFDLITTNI